MFNLEKMGFEHLKSSSNVSLSAQLEWWKSAMERYSEYAQIVSECETEIFNITRKIAANLNSMSENYVEERAYLNDFEEHGDTAIAAFGRIKQRNDEDLQSGLITWEEYYGKLSEIGGVMYETRLNQSKRWLTQESKYNDLSIEEYIAGLERMKAYTEEYYSNRIITYREYCDSMQALSNAVADKENEAHKAVYESWLKDAKNWKKARDTYDDWSDMGDSPVKFYQRCIERIEELYKEGHIGWQEYMDQTTNYSLDLYGAQMQEIDDLLDAQAAYISRLKTEAYNGEKALKEKWDFEDRETEMARLKGQLNIYRGAVTEKGKNRYAEFAQDLKALEREKELYNLQKSNNAAITALEEEYSVMESNKRLLLSSIENSGINVERLINGINSEISGIESVMANIASKIINAINSKNTYSDNRSFNISAADGSTLRQFAKNVEETIARGRYY